MIGTVLFWTALILAVAICAGGWGCLKIAGQVDREQEALQRQREDT